MKTALLFIKHIFLVILILVLHSCVVDDVGTDTDGATPDGFPEVTTRTVVTSDQGTSIETGGTVTNTGGSAITVRGVSWSTQPNPTIKDEVTNDGAGEGAFTSSVNNLEPNTRYYLRAYATNKNGTSYGGEVDFFTGKITRRNVFLTSQEEVNDFGNENYITIIGNLSIGSTEGSDIVDLSPLNGLNQVRGELVIGGSARFGDGFIRLSNPLLESLDGLENLAAITPFFLNDFDNKALRISENESLKNINALSGLRIFEGELTIGENPRLESLAGLEALTNIDRLSITTNSGLKDLNGLANLKKINGALFLTGNTNLENVEILNNISGRIATFVLNGNPLITNLDFMGGITEVFGNLILKDSPLLTDISGIYGVTSVAGFLEINGTGLTAIDNLNEIKSVGQYISIRDNANLEKITGLNGLTNVKESVEIIFNEKLNTLNGFNKLVNTGARVTAINGTVVFSTGISINNNGLKILDGFENLISLEGGFGIAENTLNDIVGFEKLETIGEDFNVSVTSVINDITGFGAIKTIDGDLRIEQNRQLQNLNFLSSLETLGGNISISFNNNLSDFCGLQDLEITDSSGDVNINFNAFNPSLEEIANGNCSN